MKRSFISYPLSLVGGPFDQVAGPHYMPFVGCSRRLVVLAAGCLDGSIGNSIVAILLAGTSLVTLFYRILFPSVWGGLARSSACCPFRLAVAGFDFLRLAY